MSAPVAAVTFADQSALSQVNTDPKLPEHVLTDSTSATPLAQRLPLRILVAEDDPLNFKLIRIVLGGLGYNPDLARSGLEVLAALRRQIYDVVLMDMRMPEMDGIEATRCIRQQWPAERCPRILALTAGVSAKERQACLEAGVDEFLVKPAARAPLAAALERCRPIAERALV